MTSWRNFFRASAISVVTSNVSNAANNRMSPESSASFWDAATFWLIFAGALLAFLGGAASIVSRRYNRQLNALMEARIREEKRAHAPLDRDKTNGGQIATVPIYYRGAGTGTYWNLNDATALGFQPRDPGITPSTTRIIQHVAHGSTLSPYVSLTRSHPVALYYALETGTNQPTAHAPAYVYEIEIDERLSGVTLIDPLKEIAAAAVGPFDPVGYQHDGHPTVLLGVVSSLLAFFLHMPIPQSAAGGTGVRYANISPFIWGLTASLRDAEILAVGNIPRNCVIRRDAVY